MKYGICNWILPLELEEAFRFSKKMGLEGMAIGIKFDKDDINIRNRDLQKRLLDFTNKYEMEIPDFALNFLCDISMTSVNNEEKIKAYIIDVANIAKEINVDTLMIPSFRESEIKTIADFNQTLRILEYACEYCGGLGIQVGWENVLSSQKNIDMIKMINKQNFFIYFDTQNPLRMNNLDNVSLAKDLNQYIRRMHAKDSHEDEKLELYLGEGNTNFNKVIKVLTDNNNIEWLLLESYYKVYSNYKNIVQQDLEHARNLFEKK